MAGAGRGARGRKLSEPVAVDEGRFEGRVAFQDLLRRTLARAAAEGWPQLILCDGGFEDWPLGERAVVQSLHDWSAAGRHCTLLARQWDAAIARHARFVEWRGTWSHIIEARACRQADPAELPSALWSPALALHRLDPVRCTGIVSSEANRRFALHELLASWLRRSTPAFPATTLGL